MPRSYVKPYVKRGKNDVAGAEAICEAVQRPTMRFVPIKSVEQQSVLMLHRERLGSLGLSWHAAKCIARRRQFRARTGSCDHRAPRRSGCEDSVNQDEKVSPGS
jgi:transposase